MSGLRNEYLRALNEQLTDEQKEMLRMVIETADVQGDWILEEEESVCVDDVQATLLHLAREFK